MTLTVVKKVTPMATLYLPLPAPSNFNLAMPNQWAKWKQRFQLFRKATGLSEVQEARQVSTLLYCLGEDAASILSNISTEDAKIYSKVLDKLDSIFETRKSTLEGPQEVLSKRYIDKLYLGTIGNSSASSPKAWKVNLVYITKKFPSSWTRELRLQQ